MSLYLGCEHKDRPEGRDMEPVAQVYHCEDCDRWYHAYWFLGRPDWSQVSRRKAKQIIRKYKLKEATHAD